MIGQPTDEDMELDLLAPYPPPCLKLRSIRPRAGVDLRAYARQENAILRHHGVNHRVYDRDSGLWLTYWDPLPVKQRVFDPGRPG